MKFDERKGCWRAEFGDVEYGSLCPDCPNLKDDQALLCKSCRKEKQRRPDFWERRTCACGRDKSPYSDKCQECESQRRRDGALPPRDADGWFLKIAA